MPILPLVRCLTMFGLAISGAACSGDAPMTPKPPPAPRAVAPQCSLPAQLLGTFSIPGYIVVFQDTVDAAAETARLAETYQFTPTHVYSTALRGFSASLADTVVAALRCERSVRYIEYDQVFHLD